MFGFPEIRFATSPDHVPADERDIDLPALEGHHRIGVGRGGDESYVLVGPGQAQSLGVEGTRYHFEPWKELVDSRSGAVLRDVCVLKFWPIDDTDEIREAIAAVFAGLIELARSSPTSLGSAVAAMSSLFESGLRTQVDRETEIGLAGELLVIAEATDPSSMAVMWHSRADGQFDFSTQGERLEVKATTGANRVHWFASGQVAPIPGVCTTFMSILLPLVEVGSTVASVFASLNGLTAEQLARVRNVVIDVAKEPPELLTSVIFDRDAARASMLHFPAASVPAPQGAPGVGRINWEATIDGNTAGAAPSCRVVRVLGL